MFFQKCSPQNPGGDDPILTCAYFSRMGWFGSATQLVFCSTNLFCPQERPFNLFMGGGRSKTKAPMLSWYRNPQFRVSMKPGQARVGYGWGVGEFGAPLKKTNRRGWKMFFLGEVHDQFVLVSFHDDVLYYFQYISIPFFC